MPEPPDDLHLALERVALDGVALRTPREVFAHAHAGAPVDSTLERALYVEARFEPRPFHIDDLEEARRDAPLLLARLDLSCPRSAVRCAALERHAGDHFDRFTRGEGGRAFGWVMFCGPRSVYLPTPFGVEVLDDESWDARFGADPAEMRLGLDLLDLGCLVFIGERSGLLPSTERTGRFWFTVPDFSEVGPAGSLPTRIDRR
jgi:hypothetical protein